LNRRVFKPLLALPFVVILLAVVNCGEDNAQPSANASRSSTTQREAPLRDARPEDLTRMILEADDVGPGFEKVTDLPPETAGEEIAESQVSYWSSELTSSEPLSGTTCIDSSVKLYATPEEAADSMRGSRDSLSEIAANPNVPDAQSNELANPGFGDESFSFVLGGTVEMVCTGFESRATEQYFVYSRLNKLLSRVSIITLDVGVGPEEVLRLAERQIERMRSVLSTGQP